MRIITTGGLGFIGSNFVQMMMPNDDVEIINIDNLSYGSNRINLKKEEKNKGYHFVKGDICDYSLLSSMLEEGNVDAIVNFAAETHVDRSISEPFIFMKSNTGGLINILEAVRKSDSRATVIQIGTDESYGDINNGSFKESDRLKPSSPYSASKAAADLFALAYYRTYGIPIKITRCTNNFGPYQFPEKLIPKTIIRAKKGLKIPVYGKGKNVRDWIYVIDHCRGIQAVLEKGKAGEIYNISSGNEVENITIVTNILKIMSLSEDLIEFVEDRPGHDVRYSLDSAKIRRECGWVPSFNFEEALKETVRWYLKNERWWRPLATEQTLSAAPWKLKW